MPNAASQPRQVCARDAFGNRCSMLSSPAIRCKLICSSSNGAPTFVEARDPVAVLPFAQACAPTVSLRTDAQPSPSRLEAPAVSDDYQSCQQLRASKTSEMVQPAASDTDASFAGEVDIGRYCHANPPLLKLELGRAHCLELCHPASSRPRQRKRVFAAAAIPGIARRRQRRVSQRRCGPRQVRCRSRCALRMFLRRFLCF